MLSIIKRRDALGLLAHGDEEERFTRTRSEIDSGVAIALGGLTAEELFFGESGDGSGFRPAAATTLAAQMVGSFGMAGSLVSFDAIARADRSRNIVGKVLADGQGKARVEEILTEQKERVAKLLDENRDVVVGLRDSLIARDELVGRRDHAADRARAGFSEPGREVGRGAGRAARLRLRVRSGARRRYMGFGFARRRADRTPPIPATRPLSG